MFPMISEHGTEKKLFSMRVEILGLDKNQVIGPKTHFFYLIKTYM